MGKIEHIFHNQDLWGVKIKFNSIIISKYFYKSIKKIKRKTTYLKNN